MSLDVERGAPVAVTRGHPTVVTSAEAIVR